MLLRGLVLLFVPVVVVIRVVVVVMRVVVVAGAWQGAGARLAPEGVVLRVNYSVGQLRIVASGKLDIGVVFRLCRIAHLSWLVIIVVRHVVQEACRAVYGSCKQGEMDLLSLLCVAMLNEENGG